MPRATALALVGGLLAFAAALATPGAALDPACGALGAGRMLQDDASSGRDAGDTPEGAVPILEENYVWGFLDTGPVITPVSTGADDLHDWFWAPVPAGQRAVSFGIVAQPWYGLGVPPDVLQKLYPPLPVYELEVWRPGATEALTTSSILGNVTVPSEEGGTWLFHAYVTPFFGVFVCSPASAPPSLALLPEEAQDYGVYFGCDPVCLPTSQDLPGM